MYELGADYHQRLMNGEDASTIGIGTYGLRSGHLVRTMPDGRTVRVPTSFEEAKQLAHGIHVEFEHLKFEGMSEIVRERLFIQFQSQLIGHVLHACHCHEQ